VAEIILMLDAVLIVLREVLEASLFLSLLLALGNKLETGRRWAVVAVLGGLLGSWLLSRHAYALAEAFEGMGQELLNTALYLAAITSFAALNVMLVPRLLNPSLGVSNVGSVRAVSGAFQALFVVIVMCSMAREGAEVWIYLSAFVGVPDALAAGMTGGLIGAGIGVSIGVIVYYALHFVSPRSFFRLFFVIATLVVGGLSMQAAKQLMQIGWLESGSALWSTRWLIEEQSWLGQLLHALFGYVAKPDRTQVICYLGSLLLILLSSAIRALYLRRGNHG
jgi:high-affinity iron transporter